MISFEDFAKLNIRIGEVTAAEIPEGSRSLVKLTVDFGEEMGERTIFAGIKAWYSPDGLVGKQMPFLTNLEPRKMGELGYSQGMLMAASPKGEDGQERAVLMEVTEEVAPGTKVR